MPRDVSTLLEALPYIRQFHGQTIVIKYGGAAMVEDSLRESFARDIVRRINRYGQLAVGFSGDDGALFRTSKTMPGGIDIGFVGKVDHVNTDLLDHVRDDYISVIASVGSDRDGQSYNINADDAAGAVAQARGASKTI